MLQFAEISNAVGVSGEDFQGKGVPVFEKKTNGA
jgi:hypothetical protein